LHLQKREKKGGEEGGVSLVGQIGQRTNLWGWDIKKKKGHRNPPNPSVSGEGKGEFRLEGFSGYLPVSKKEVGGGKKGKFRRGPGSWRKHE